jgi:beta-lactamase class A
MGKKLRYSCDNRDTQIAQLKAELERAYQIIDQLRFQETEIHDQGTSTFQNDAGRSDPSGNNSVPGVMPQNRELSSHNRYPAAPVKKKVIKSRPTVRQRSSNKLSHLLFVTIVAVITANLILFVGVRMLRSTSKPVKIPLPTPSLFQTPHKIQTFIPFHSPARPSWAIAKSIPAPSRQSGQNLSEIAYNIQTTPHFTHSPQLQTVVDQVVRLAVANRFPKQSLSITLIDPKTGETAGYQQDVLRYPASVVKMFWMVALYAQIEGKIWSSEQDFEPYIAKMIEESNNDAASFILDEITGTESVPTLRGERFREWVNKRLQVSRFFQKAGYKDIILSQKTFPIEYLSANEPLGNDLRIQQILKQPDKPFRNLITTEHAARLLYEICYSEEAVSTEASKTMCGWLKRDLDPKVWNKSSKQYMAFNPVRGFFGESLTDKGIQLYSKAGWTSRARHEAAFVVSPDGRTSYILAIFGANKAYARDGRMFPKMSHFVYERMIGRNIRQ